MQIFICVSVGILNIAVVLLCSWIHVESYSDNHEWDCCYNKYPSFLDLKLFLKYNNKGIDSIRLQGLASNVLCTDLVFQIFK